MPLTVDFNKGWEWKQESLNHSVLLILFIYIWCLKEQRLDSYVGLLWGFLLGIFVGLPEVCVCTFVFKGKPVRVAVKCC